ncbi:transcription termination factor NusA [Candidatus Woesebacteria bacterium]|nr:MAG: transcription termination factor NusA [Candidatus Woesebacteria bacterium]
MQTPRTEFAQALKAIAAERGLEAEVILETIKQAIVAAYKRDAREYGEEEEAEEMMYEVELDPVNGEAKVFAWHEDKPEDKKDVTPPGFGRIAAQTAKQVIHQKIKEAEKGAVMDEYSDRVGGLVSGMILRFDGPNVRVDLGRTEGIMPVEERVPNERLNPNQRLSFLLKAIEDGPRGKNVILSRADSLFVQKLFEREVPEIGSGGVIVEAIARESGVRTKIAVSSSQPGVDPVGSCVGQKGVRVQAVTNELGGERVDIVPWSNDIKECIKSALSPAEGLFVKLDEKTKTAIVKAPYDQLSLAIGRDGQNARLAAKLTKWKIEVEDDGSQKNTSTDVEVKPQEEDVVNVDEKKVEVEQTVEAVSEDAVQPVDQTKAVENKVEESEAAKK